MGRRAIKIYKRYEIKVKLPVIKSKRVPHLRGSFPWARLGSGPLHPGGFYLGWRQGSTPSTAFDDKMGSSPPPGVEPGSMTIGPQDPYQTSYHIPS
ncbi:hypothetical protein YC2023_104461 [Brassica napus]